MNYLCSLFAPKGALSAELNRSLDLTVNLKEPDRRMRTADYLGQLLAQTLVTPGQVLAASVFCWDESGEFGDFQSLPPEIWLADRLSTSQPGDWVAEGYGDDLGNGTRSARWIVWRTPRADMEAFSVSELISPDWNSVKDNLKRVDTVLAEHLVRRDREASNAGAFIVTAGGEGREAFALMGAVQETIRNLVGAHAERALGRAAK